MCACHSVNGGDGGRGSIALLPPPPLRDTLIEQSITLIKQSHYVLRLRMGTLNFKIACMIVAYTT